MERKESVTVTLKTPLANATGKPVESLTLRRPKAGDLRGISQVEILRMVPEPLCTLVGRISDPAFPPSLFWQMEAEDLMELSGAVAGFFVTLGSPTE